ncbi:MAG: adenosylcobinamide-phosphate synthase CbiB [Methyloligellaceae bacterium]
MSFFFDPTFTWLCLASLLLERLVSLPRGFIKIIGHPVIWMGTVLGWLDYWLNNPKSSSEKNKRSGLYALLLYLALCLGVAIVLSITLSASIYLIPILIFLASTLFAQTELQESVKSVADELDVSLGSGRKALGHIVGRDRESLDEAGVSRAAIESLAENTSDAVIAPALWCLVGGLPGLVFYKAVNTADSMIGYKNSKYLNFGWTAARIDDLINLPASRLTGLLYIMAASLKNYGQLKPGWKTMWRDAPNHVSPNAGWPEAALAGVLDIQLGGARTYKGDTTNLPTMGTGRRDLTSDDIRKCLELYTAVLNLLLGIIAFIWLATLVF